jgi:acyl carrier protein
MFETIKSIIEDQLAITDLEKITMNTNLREDLEADSLDAVEIIMAVEDELDIEIPDEIAERFQTVGQIVDYLEGLK